MVTLRAYSVIALVVGLLSGCGRTGEVPEKGVDTTLPDTPGKLTGSLSFPSDYIPKDLRVCAEAVEGSKLLCNAQISGDSYTLEVPAGEYRVFAQTAQMPGQRAYYSEFVECGYYSWCPSHEPLKVAIEERQTRSGVNPGDWYVQQSSQPTSADEGGEDSEGNGGSVTDSPVQDDEASSTIPENMSGDPSTAM